jgi:hypothetical protein
MDICRRKKDEHNLHPHRGLYHSGHQRIGGMMDPTSMFLLGLCIGLVPLLWLSGRI